MRVTLVFGVLLVVLAASVVVGVLIGAVAIAPGEIFGALFGNGDATTIAIVRDLRLPRVIGAALVGGALAVAGTLLQGLLRNPLADPYVTGTSAGASLGAVATIALGVTTPFILPLGAFAGAIVAVSLTWRLAALGGRTTVLSVLLGGVVLTSFAGALLTFLIVAAVVIGAGALLAIGLAPRLDAFAFGEETAATLGVDVDRTATAVLVTTAVLTAAAVALGGVVGFVGLVVPHALRPFVGAPHRGLVPAAFLAGAATLVLADVGARSVLAPSELPVGVITGAVGGPFFLAVLIREQRRMRV